MAFSYLPLPSPASNRIDAQWYQPWQSGYHDILKRGFPRPDDGRTILAELHSPRIYDFLHPGVGDVPFLVSKRGRDVLDQRELSGFEYAPVEISKIATKGLRSRKVKGGEPEDSISKARGIDLAMAPQLFAVYVTGRIVVIPDDLSGRTPSGCVSPFCLTEVDDGPDLWRPEYNGVSFSAWTFCSDRFRTACEEGRLSNIKFERFESFMAGFRAQSLDRKKCG
jgi:hypothetical protein